MRHQQWINTVFGADLSRLPDALRRPRHNVTPGQMVLALARQGDGPVAEQLRWGVPSPRGDATPALINARAETVETSRFWRPMLENGRILIPADGFYEWRSGARVPKQPYWFARDDETGFFFAGLSRKASGGVAGVIVTTTANELVDGIHHRMPAMLDVDEARAWLEGPATEAASLLTPYPSIEMRARPVSLAVNDASRDEPELIEPVDVDTTPPSLF